MNVHVETPVTALQRAVLRVPQDVWLPIFELVSLQSTEYLENPDLAEPLFVAHSRIRISHICRAWRQICLSTPSFWSYIDLIDDSCADELIKRSAEVDLRVSYHAERCFAEERKGDTIYRGEYLHLQAHAKRLLICLPRARVIQITGFNEDLADVGFHSYFASAGLARLAHLRVECVQNTNTQHVARLLGAFRTDASINIHCSTFGGLDLTFIPSNLSQLTAFNRTTYVEFEFTKSIRMRGLAQQFSDLLIDITTSWKRGPRSSLPMRGGDPYPFFAPWRPMVTHLSLLFDHYDNDPIDLWVLYFRGGKGTPHALAFVTITAPEQCIQTLLLSLCPGHIGANNSFATPFPGLTKIAIRAVIGKNDIRDAESNSGPWDPQSIPLVLTELSWFCTSRSEQGDAKHLEELALNCPSEVLAKWESWDFLKRIRNVVGEIRLLDGSENRR